MVPAVLVETEDQAVETVPAVLVEMEDLAAEMVLAELTAWVVEMALVAAIRVAVILVVEILPGQCLGKIRISRRPLRIRKG